MDGGSVLLLSLSFFLIFFFIQRAEVNRRRIVIFSMLLVVILIVWYANNASLQREALIGFFVGLILSFLFWLLIGRYNPVGSSDSIRVLGMDD